MDRHDASALRTLLSHLSCLGGRQVILQTPKSLCNSADKNRKSPKGYKDKHEISPLRHIQPSERESKKCDKKRCQGEFDNEFG